MAAYPAVYRCDPRYGDSFEAIEEPLSYNSITHVALPLAGPEDYL